VCVCCVCCVCVSCARSIVIQCHRNEEVISTNNPVAHPLFNPTIDRLMAPKEIGALLCIPICPPTAGKSGGKGKAFGVLCLQKYVDEKTGAPRRGGFSAAKGVGVAAQYGMVAGGMLGAALQKRSLQDAAGAHRRMLEMVHSLSMATSVRALGNVIAGHLQEMQPSQLVMIYEVTSRLSLQCIPYHNSHRRSQSCRTRRPIHMTYACTLPHMYTP